MQPDKDGDQMPSTSPDAEGKSPVPERQQTLPTVSEGPDPAKSVVDRWEFEIPKPAVGAVAGLLAIAVAFAVRHADDILKAGFKQSDNVAEWAVRGTRGGNPTMHALADPRTAAFFDRAWIGDGSDAARVAARILLRLGIARATRNREGTNRTQPFAEGRLPKEFDIALAAGTGCSLVGVSADQYAASMVWGNDDSAQCSSFPLDSTKRQRSASAESADAAVLEAAFGERHGVALVRNWETPRTGASTSVIAWGAGDSGQVEVPSALRGEVEVRAIAAGARHSVAVDSTGKVICWGDNGLGQCRAPDRLPGATRVAAGGNASFALVGSGVVWAWGDVRFGQCSVPPSLASAIEIDGGERHAVALAPSGSVVCWGDDSEGQCRIPALQEPCLHVSAGGAHTVVLTRSGRIITFGRNSEGQCASPSCTYGMRFVEIAAGRDHSIALRSDGIVVGWGANEHGQLSPPYAEIVDAARLDGSRLYSSDPFADQEGVDLIPDGTPPPLLHRDSEMEFTVVPKVRPQ